MNAKQTKAARVIRDHYGLARPVTPEEVSAEIADVKRKRAEGSLDDKSEILAARLEWAGVL